MCGFAGFIDFKLESNPFHLKEMTDAIKHRGPDASNHFFQEYDSYSIGLGHRRLSIIDLSSHANQPMHYKHFTTVFNGEIYNYQEIKKELVGLGHQFITSSDTEVILHSFEEWGTDCVHKFIGMFVFVIYDNKNQNITVFRDRPGVKPFYYYWDGTLFLMGSEIKSFHQHPNFRKSIDLSSVYSFLQYGYIPSPNSIFENIKKLPPGCTLKFDCNTKDITIKKYWTVDEFYEKPKLAISFDEAKVETKKIIQSACQYRMVSDVPVGVFLSGGYDSTLVTSILQSNAISKIKTFTIGVEDKKLNEATFAKDIAKYLGTEHTEIYCTETEMLEIIDKLPFYFDEPFGDSSAIPTILVSELAKKSVKVALSADGGDEVFAGYNRYDYISKLEKIQKLAKLPLPFGFFIKKFIKNDLESSRYLKMFEDSSAINLADVLNSGYKVNSLLKLFKNPLFKIVYDKKQNENLNIKDNLSQFMVYDYKTYLPDDILTKVDRAAMSASIEGREPLLDHRIIEYAAQLPNDYKYFKGVKKHILKEITYDYVPKEIMERPKMGFAVPVFNWFQNALKPKLDYYCSEEFITTQDLFNYDEINKLKTAVLNKTDKHYQKLWYLLIFQMWYEKWMNNTTYRKI